MKNIITGVVCLLIGLFVFKFFPNLFSGSETEEFLILSQIKKVAKLQTVEYTGHEIMTKTIKDWAGASTTMTFVAVGKVVGSIDLDKMESRKDETTKTVFIKLPKVELSYPTAEVFKEICKEKKGLGPEPSRKQRNDWHKNAFDKIQSTAKKKGIEKMAVDNAKDYLKIFIEGFGWQVKFE